MHGYEALEIVEVRRETPEAISVVLAVPAAHREAFLKSLNQRKGPAPSGARALSAAERAKLSEATVWVADGEFVRPVRVRTGLTDGTVTEIVEGELSEEMEVVVGEAPRGEGGGNGNPFGPPSMFGSKKKQ